MSDDLVERLRWAGSVNSREAADEIERLFKKLELYDHMGEVAKVLGPFADIAGEGSEDFPDDTKVTITFGRTTHHALTLGDLRRAKRILDNLMDEVFTV